MTPENIIQEEEEDTVGKHPSSLREKSPEEVALETAERVASTKKAKFEGVRYNHLLWMARIVPWAILGLWLCLLLVWVATVLGEDKSPAVLVDMLDTMLIAILIMPSAAFAVIYTRAFPSQIGMSSGESSF